MRSKIFTEIINAVALEEYRKKLHKPGEEVKISGIYDVVHDTEHAELDEHQVTCVEGDKFPPCRKCGKYPRFNLRYEAKHISHDDNLERN